MESWELGVILGKGGGGGSVDPYGEPSKSRGFQGGQRRRAILKSWCYTRRNGAASIQAESHPIPGNSRWCSAWLSSKGVATSRSTPVGSRRRWCDLKSFVYTRVAWWTAITKSNLDFVYNRSLPDSVYTRSFPRFCLYQVISKILFIPGHFQDSVYTRSLLDFVYKRVVLS